MVRSRDSGIAIIGSFNWLNRWYIHCVTMRDIKKFEVKAKIEFKKILKYEKKRK